MPKKQKQENDDCYSDDDASRRRDEVVRFMVNTPPRPKATSPHLPKKKKKAVAGRAVRKVRARRED